jgi:hypothetical protein
MKRVLYWLIGIGLLMGYLVSRSHDQPRWHMSTLSYLLLIGFGAFVCGRMTKARRIRRVMPQAVKASLVKRMIGTLIALVYTAVGIFTLFSAVIQGMALLYDPTLMGENLLASMETPVRGLLMGIGCLGFARYVYRYGIGNKDKETAKPPPTESHVRGTTLSAGYNWKQS